MQPPARCVIIGRAPRAEPRSLGITRDNVDSARQNVPGSSQHLARQLRFLASSANELDRGDADEAIRIATAIRVIVHHTSNSSSLLAQLGVPEVSLLSTTRGFFEDGPGEKPWVGASSFHYDGAGFLRQTAEGLLYRPKLGDGSYRGYLSAQDWWRQVIFGLDPTTIYSRRAIVLGAANQDGGAHVDPNPDERYLRLAYKQEFGVLVGQSPEGEVRIPLYGYHVVALRQMAYELLNSPALMALSEA